MEITAITTCCHRPDAFSIVESYMARQTVKPVQWLCLDDDEIPTKCTMGQEYHYWPEYRGRGSLAKKLRRALEDNLVKGDAIVFIENDDWVSADYMAWMADGLKQFALYGEGRALYYNVHHRHWFEHVNMQHASLCATGLTKALFPWLLKQVQISDEPFVDVRLWHKVPLSSRVYDPYSKPDRRRHSVGIKAMPGRTGYGGGHRGRDKSAVDDLHLTKLKSLIGADADLYAKFYEPSAAPLPPERNGHVPRVHRHAHIPQRPMNLNTHIAKSEAGRVHGENWKNWFAEFRGKEVMGFEIGTFEGDSAEWMLDNVANHPNSQYHCIDPFTGAEDHHFHKIDTSKTEARTREKLARFPNVVIHKGYSQDVLHEFKKGTFHFGYCDGSHTARDVLRDLVLSFDLLKPGGVMACDDYTWAAMPNELDRPKVAIDAFLKCYGKQLRVLAPRGYQIAFQKISD